MDRDEAASTQVLVEELGFGKPVRAPEGPVVADAEHGITSRSTGLKNPLSLLPERLVDASLLAPSTIDRSFVRRGALVFAVVDAGLAAMRLRFRAEAGEGADGRQYLLAAILLLPGARLWRDVPPGFFSWCESELDAAPHVVGDAASVPARIVTLPTWVRREPEWLDGLEEWRQFQLCSAFQAITAGRGWLAAHPPAEARESRPGAILAEDLDVIASLELELPLGHGGSRGHVFAMGIDPALTPGAIAFVPGRRGGAVEAPDFAALRQLFGRAGFGGEPQRAGRRPALLDSRGRAIGREPIPLGAS